ncbi:MAG: putative O-glycosylation ligase, exosortase A system-associated [Gammaproteobacteria bacterium]|nr:MAG: putative O-glycosylation ligase, exosortase A system-associated [Gammaproteobacteria bacterium]
MRDIALALIFISILLYVFSRPYVGIYLWTWLGLMNPHRLAYGFAYSFPFAQITAIVTLMALFASKEPKRIPWTRETVLLLIFAMWMLFTTFFAFYPDAAWEQWGKVWKIILMIYITLMLINTRQKLHWLVWVVVLSLGLYGVKGGIFTILTGGAYRVQGPYGSFISGNNEMGLALIIIIPLMRYLQLQTRNFWVRHSLAVSMLLTGVAAIGTQSRGALVGMAVMGSFLALKSRNKIFMLLSILVVVGSVTAIMPQEWHDRMSTIKDYEQDSSAIGRLNAWKTAFNIAKDRVTGGGYETFKPRIYYLYSDNKDKVTSTDAHSIYFEVMAEHGFVGFSLFMLLGWFTWNTGSRTRTQARQSEETKWGADLANMLQVSLVGYATAGAFLGLAYFDLYYDLVAMMVICQVVVREQILQIEAAADTTEPGVAVATAQPDS